MKEIKNIDELLKKVKDSGYGYYYDDRYSFDKILKRERQNGLNCNDMDKFEEEMNKYQKHFFRKYICREMTDEEKEWFDKQPKLDLNAPENKHLRDVLQAMQDRGWFDDE